MKPRIAIYALTRRGATLGGALAESLTPNASARLHTPASLQLPENNPFDSLMERVAEQFHQCDGHVFIAAAGIAVRAIAGLLRDKQSDPAVVVMDQEGNHVISLLAGHLGGANDLAQQVATLVGGTPVITTATDTAGLPSLDMMAKERDLTIDNLESVKLVNAALLDGRMVQVFDPDDRLGLHDNDRFLSVTEPEDWNESLAGVWVDHRTTAPGATELRLHPRCVVAGLGCRKGVVAGEIMAHLRTILASSRIAEGSLCALATIEEKRSEPGLTDVGRELGIPMLYFTKEQLNAVDEAAASELVRRHMGVDSVCEAAAILASKGGPLLVSKQKSERVTCALAILSS